MRNNDHLYRKGYTVQYPEGDESKEREKLVYVRDTEDRLYVVKEGDTLTYIANKYYGKPFKWYVIADINQIYNPFVLVAGTELIIPGLNKYDV